MKIITGDLLTAKGIIVHGCNCQGVMGSGVARQIRAKWPAVYDSYKERERDMALYLGNAQMVRVEPDVWVVNAMTQEFYGRDGERYVSYEAVKEAFTRIKPWATILSVPVNFPLIGCGLAGGSWEIVGLIIKETLGPDIEQVLWLPQGEAWCTRATAHN